MDSFELAQRHYFHEIERRSDLDRSMSLPLALVTALLAGTLTLLKEITIPVWWAEAMLAVFCMPAIIVLLVAITNLVRASIGYLYAHPATIAEQFEWRNQLLTQGRSKLVAEEEFTKLLISEYADCASINARHNDYKAEYLENARFYLVIAVCLLVVAGVPYLIVTADKNVAAHRADTIVRDRG